MTKASLNCCCCDVTDKP